MRCFGDDPLTCGNADPRHAVPRPDWMGGMSGDRQTLASDPAAPSGAKQKGRRPRFAGFSAKLRSVSRRRQVRGCFRA